jgi:hypothetical protein
MRGREFRSINEIAQFAARVGWNAREGVKLEHESSLVRRTTNGKGNIHQQACVQVIVL